MPTYGASGLLTGIKKWVGTATTDASGNWTASLTPAGFTAAPISVQAQAIGANQTVGSAVQAVVTARAAGSVSGMVVQPVTLLALGLTAAKAGAGIVVMIEATGT